MNVEVKLVGFFQTGRFKQKTCVYPAGVTAQEIFDDLQLPAQHLGIILINGLHAKRDTVLTEGDQLSLMPLLGGG
jgi:sulfur carrier protein ThiS